jgi:hypothetical protein
MIYVFKRKNSTPFSELNRMQKDMKVDFSISDSNLLTILTQTALYAIKKRCTRQDINHVNSFEAGRLSKKILNRFPAGHFS